MMPRSLVVVVVVCSVGIADAQEHYSPHETLGRTITSTYRQRKSAQLHRLPSRVDPSAQTNSFKSKSTDARFPRNGFLDAAKPLRSARRNDTPFDNTLPQILKVVSLKELPRVKRQRHFPIVQTSRWADDDDLLVDEDETFDEETRSPSDIDVRNEDNRPTNGDDDLLADDDDVLSVEATEKEQGERLENDRESDTQRDAPSSDTNNGERSNNHVDPHYELFAKNCYPSATECKKCHEQHYREWSVSSHAYATVSPMFQKFEQTINNLAKGTISYFCLRCHSPIATALEVGRDESPWDQIPAAREGVTCIVCHRVVETYGKVNGERRIEKGSIFAPVVGRKLNSKLHEVLGKKDHYKVKTSPDDKGPGQSIHNDVIEFEQIGSSHFCVSCHQVAVYPGIKLEIVWEQYRASPACKKGVTCQDCHMGSVPGKALGYDTAPTAIVGDKEINPNRRHSNHMFVGPGYSIAHPGTFPWNPKSEKWDAYEWLEFDWRAGWGTEKFEELVDDEKIAASFPSVWENSDDRMDAREIIDQNLKLLAEKKRNRFLLMENTSKVNGPYFKHMPKTGTELKFHYVVHNLNDGHHMPSGSLGAQPQLWLNVALSDSCGNRIWESGYVDANGDMADLHSLEVLAGRLKPDQQLFNLQTKFLITHVKGPDREMYLPVNTDFDQLPFIRPSGFPIMNLNHPPFIRLETHSVPPLGSKKAKYSVPAKLLQTPGKYRLTVRMRSRAEPIYFMRFCGSTPEMERGMNERMLNYHQQAYDFIVK